MDSTEQTTRHTAAPSSVWTLTIVHHPNVASIGRRIVLEGGARVTLGRELAVLDGESDRKLSRAHAVVRLEGGRPTIADENSRNGTFVDGSPVERAELHEDAVIGVGNILLLCHRRPPFFSLPDNPRVIAISAVMSEVLEEIRRAASRRDAVTLVGETGVGKGLLAEELHLASGRSGPFVTVHCGALADDRLHAQLFGEGGSPGLLEGAEGGTLFLDGVDDARPALQAALLSFLERGEVRRVGAVEARSLDVRVVASSNAGLRASVGEGRLRGDFASRLGVAAIEIPPLRMRREDIGAIAARFVEGLEGAPLLHHSLVLALLRHDWPGNVRELQSALGHAASHRESEGELRLDPRTAALLVHPEVDAAPESREGFVVARGGGWFDTPDTGRVSLENRKQLERILSALVDAHEAAPGRALSVADLVHAGWPGEKVLPRAGASRVYVSITSLRKMGLRDAIERAEGGYRLDARVRIEG